MSNSKKSASLVHRVDSLGRIVIPKTFRKRLGLEPGTQFELSECDGELRLRPMQNEKLAITHIQMAVKLLSEKDAYDPAIPWLSSVCNQLENPKRKEKKQKKLAAGKSENEKPEREPHEIQVEIETEQETST